MNEKNVAGVYLVRGWENGEVQRFAEKVNDDKGCKFVFGVHWLRDSDLNKWFG